MNRRLLGKWAAWLLPLLALRAFMPVGFMLSADAEGLALMFCPGQTPGFVQAFKSGSAVDHSRHRMLHAAHHAGGDAQLDPPCPYALAAFGVVVEVPPPGAPDLQLADDIIPPRSIFVSGAGPVRAERIRGPPSLS